MLVCVSLCWYVLVCVGVYVFACVLVRVFAHAYDCVCVCVRARGCACVCSMDHLCKFGLDRGETNMVVLVPRRHELEHVLSYTY